MSDTRLNKYLSEKGICSRRSADRMIAAGRVKVDGVTAVCGMRVREGQRVSVDGEEIDGGKPKKVLLLVNKPVGIVCTAEKRELHNIVDLIHYPERIYPIGRLDKDSHGLILMTNVGALHNEITRAAGGHEKEYIVEVDRRISAEFVRRMSRGVYLSGLSRQTAPTRVRKLSEKVFSIVLTQGVNRQIRRMCEECAYGVVDLKRIRVMHFSLEGIAEGAYREASAEEWQQLEKDLCGAAQ